MRLSPTTRTFFLVVASLLIAARALAVDIDSLKGTTPKERAEAQTLMMKEELGLSDAQVEKVRAINLKYAEKDGSHDPGPRWPAQEGAGGDEPPAAEGRGAEGRAVGGRVQEVSRVEAGDARSHRRASLRGAGKERPLSAKT